MLRSAIGVLFPSVLLILLAARPAPGQAPAAGTEPAPASERRAASPTPAPTARIVAQDTSSSEKDAEEKASGAADHPSRQQATPLPPLSSEMAALRDQVRRTLAQVYARPLNTQDHLPAEIIAFCEAFGPAAEILSPGLSNQPVNGVGALCWNFPCGGYRLLRTNGNAVIAQVGYGYQQRPGQLLAMLAIGGVSPDYEVRIGESRASVADLIAAEKRACLSGLDLSGVLIGLSFYAKPGESWKNADGDAWSVERLVREELDRTAEPSSIDVMDRLTGLSFALARIGSDQWQDASLPDRAKRHIAECQDFAFRLQNSDGSWHPEFFARQGTSNDAAGSLRASGAILAWLAFSMPEEKLDDPRLVRSLQYVNQQLASRASPRGAMPATTREIAGIMSGARALSLYDARYFSPRTPPEPAPETTNTPSSGTAAAHPAPSVQSPSPAPKIGLSESRQPSASPDAESRRSRR